MKSAPQIDRTFGTILSGKATLNQILSNDFEDMIMTLEIPFLFGDIAWIMKDCDWFLVGSFVPHTFDKVLLWRGFLMVI